VTDKLCALLVFIFCIAGVHAHATNESVAQQSVTDTADTTSAVVDVNPLGKFLNGDSSRSLILTGDKPIVNDIEQSNNYDGNTIVFILLVILLAALTYLKTAFGKDLDDLVQSVVSQNLAQQIFRTQSKEISFSSAVLNLNFIVVMSLYVRFVLVKYFHASSLQSVSSILFMNFLFTFFYLGKIAVLKVIGVLFEVSDACEEYIFNFTIVCKTLGLALLPALFIFYTAPQKFFNFIFIVSVFVFVFMVLTFIWRGLSTVYKLLYRSVYHFFIYVCVVEISSIFLLFKLLTKTIN
jgi:hypothetical protein